MVDVFIINFPVLEMLKFGEWLTITSLNCNSSINVASNISDEQETEVLIESFNAQDVNTKADSVKASVEIGEPAVEHLIQALDSKDPEVRIRADEALGRLGDERAPLTDALNL